MHNATLEADPFSKGEEEAGEPIYWFLQIKESKQGTVLLGGATSKILKRAVYYPWKSAALQVR